MKALSIQQPDLWAILYAGRRIESRPVCGIWSPRFIVHRGPLLLHTGSGVRIRHGFPARAARIRAMGFDVPDFSALPSGAIVGRANLVDVVRTDAGGCRWHGHGAVCLLCRRTPLQAARSGACLAADPWATPDTIGLVFDAVEPLAEPIPWKGCLGLFDIPDDFSQPTARPAVVDPVRSLAQTARRAQRPAPSYALRSAGPAYDCTCWYQGHQAAARGDTREGAKQGAAAKILERLASPAAEAPR